MSQSLANQLEYANKRVKYAWARYYEAINTQLETAHTTLTLNTNVVSVESLPTHIKEEIREMSTALRKKWECPICLDMIDHGDLDITNCGHFYCKGCLAAFKQSERNAHKEKWECAVCRKKHGFRD